MYILINKIENVLKYAASVGKVFFQNNDGMLRLDDLTIENFKIVSEICTFNGLFFLNDWEGNYRIIDNSGNIKEKGMLSAFFNITDKYLGKQYGEGGKVFESIKNINLDTVFTIEFSNSNHTNAISGDHYVLLESGKKNITSFNITKSELEWRYDISEVGKFPTLYDGFREAEVSQFIAVFGDILFVLLGNGKVIGLNIETGECLIELNNCDNAHCHNVQVPLLADGYKRQPQIKYFIDVTQSVIRGISYDSYCAISLAVKTPHFEFWGLSDQLSQYGLKEIAWSRAVYKDRCIYFFDANAHQWGIFETLTKQIVWVSDKIQGVVDTEDAWGQLKEIQVDGNKVYVLDSLNRLHIYETI
jgi:hypothetical protein